MSSNLTPAYTRLALACVPFEEYKLNVVAAATGKSANNIANSSETDRENFLIAMVRPLVIYGATLNMVEEQLMELARHFNVKVTVARRPGQFTCVLGDYGNRRRKIKISDSGLRQPHALGLAEVCNVLSAVTNNDLSMSEGIAALDNMEKRDPLNRPFPHIAFAAALSACICMRAFDGSCREVLYTFTTTFLLCVLQLLCQRAGRLPSRFLEAAITVLVSLFAHDAHVHTNIIIGVLPGYLYLCNMMKPVQVVGGTLFDSYVRTAFAIIYTLSLKFGLPIMLDVVLMGKLVALVWMSKSVLEKDTKMKRSSIRVFKHTTPKVLRMAVETTVDQ